MDKIRYIITGGDNGYCCMCGGLCDRMLLEVNDTKKTYKVIGDDICLGKYCWLQVALSNGMTLVRGDLQDNELLWYKDKHKLWVAETNGDRTEYHKVVVKNNKYGKDGEFGDKLDTYTWEK